MTEALRVELSAAAEPGERRSSAARSSAGNPDADLRLELPRSVLRLLVSGDAVISVNQAAELLPLAKRDARAWLRRQGLVRDLDGRAIVVWGDVVEALRRPTAPRRPVTPLRRESL